MVEIVVNGLIFGGIYAILASGFALIFGVGRVMNMAHTAFYMVAAYVIQVCLSTLGLHPLLASVIAIIAVSLLAWAAYILCIDRIKQHETSVMVITIAIAVIFQEILLLIFGGAFRGIAPFVTGFLEIAGARVAYQQVLVILGSFIALGIMWAIIARTRLGKAIRAVSQDRETANLMGINVGRIILITVGLSAAFAGLAGAIVAPLLVIYPLMWMPPLIMILATMVLGGLGSLKGAIAGAFILGFAESAVIILVPMGGFLRQAVALGVMVIVLLVKSEGLFGVSFEEEKL